MAQQGRGTAKREDQQQLISRMSAL